MRKLSLIMLLALLAGAAPTSAQINEILKRVNAHGQALTSFKSNLTFESKDASLGETTVSQGNIVAVTGRRPAFRVELPDENKTVSVLADKFVMFDSQASILYTANLRGVDAALDGDGPYVWLATLFGPSRSLKLAGNIEYVGQENIGQTATWHLIVKPRAAASEIVRTDLWIDTDGWFARIKSTRRNGDESTVAFTKVVKNQPVDVDELKIVVKKGFRSVIF